MKNKYWILYIEDIKWLEDMEVVKLHGLMNIKPKSEVEIAQGKGINDMGLVYSMSF
uniref:Uncharacterized protein n=1 Tax=Arundo donax TaxID=35708 RepID=A0A0A9E9K9_ARUDO